MSISVKINFSTIAVCGALVGAAMYKPPQSSFQNYFSDYIRNKLKEQRDHKENGYFGNLFSTFTDLTASEAISRLSDRTYKDYIFFSIMKVDVGQPVPLMFLGAYNRWFPLNAR